MFEAQLNKFQANYINRDAMFCGKISVLVPSRIARVCCRAAGMLSKTGRPRRVTNSRNNCWFRFKSKYSLQMNIETCTIRND